VRGRGSTGDGSRATSIAASRRFCSCPCQTLSGMARARLQLQPVVPLFWLGSQVRGHQHGAGQKVLADTQCQCPEGKLKRPRRDCRLAVQDWARKPPWSNRPGADPCFGVTALSATTGNPVAIANARQSIPFFPAIRWMPDRDFLAVEGRAQATEGGTVALNGNAGGKAQAGNNFHWPARPTSAPGRVRGLTHRHSWMGGGRAALTQTVSSR
jgi:hypothetical protein